MGEFDGEGVFEGLGEGDLDGLAEGDLDASGDAGGWTWTAAWVTGVVTPGDGFAARDR